MPVQVRDALMVQLKKIGIDDETKWRSRPKHIAAAMEVSQMVENPMPGIYVATGEKTTLPHTDQAHKDTLQIFIYCIVAEKNDAEGALWDLLSDVERAVRENFKLGTVLDSGMLADVSSAPHPEMVTGKAGIGFGVVTAEAYYQTTDANP